MTDDTEHTVRMIRLKDGTLIDPLTRQPIASPQSADDRIDSDSANDGSPPTEGLGTVVPIARRSLLDLTLDRHQMAVINNVLVYTLWGLPDDEIAIQCNCTVADVLVVRELDAYTDMRDALIAGLRASYTSSAHGILSKSAVSAANVVVSNLRSTSKRMQLEAARDVLDRTGHRPADHNSINISLKNEDNLVIRIVRESDRPNIPTLDLTPNA